MMVIEIRHSAADGTLVHGTKRGDGTNEVLKSNGFRWFRTLGLWGVPGSRDRQDAVADEWVNSWAVNDADPFEGWTMARVGCHWSRELPDGRMAHLSTWQCGADSGYSLTVNYEQTRYPGLESALEGYRALAEEVADHV